MSGFRINLTVNIPVFERDLESREEDYLLIVPVWDIFEKEINNYNQNLEDVIYIQPTDPVISVTIQPLSVLSNVTPSLRNRNDTANYLSPDPLRGYIINSFILVISLFGLLGNGTVIWLLGFRMKRNPFTIYILNLAVADFGVLITVVNAALFGDAVFFYKGSHVPSLLFVLVFELFFFMFSTGQFLLVVISVDRCVAVLFPLWHRCHRPPYLSTLVCSLVWIISSMLSGIHFTLFLTQSLGGSLFLYQLIVNAFLCTPLMIVSTLTLFIKVCCKSQQRQRGKLVTVILLALLFFLIFASPLNVFYIITYFSSSPHHNLMASGLICGCLNSSINPLIYFLVGRRQKRKGSPKWSMKMALQRVFKDEADSMDRYQHTVESDL